jgi:hypothetical protein
MYDSIKIGKVELTPHFLAFLKQASYFLVYEVSYRHLTLFGNDGGPNNRLLAFEDIDILTAQKLAVLLELPPNSHDHLLRIWGKRNVFFRLYYDDSPLSQRLYNALTDLELPHDVHYGAPDVALECDGIKYREQKIGERGLMELLTNAAEKSRPTTPSKEKFIIG